MIPIPTPIQLVAGDSDSNSDSNKPGFDSDSGIIYNSAAHCLCLYQIMHLSLSLHNCNKYREFGKISIPIINSDYWK